MIENILHIVLVVGATILFIGLYKLIAVITEWIKSDMRGEE